MQLIMIDGELCAAGANGVIRHRERIDPQAAASVLAEERGIAPALAVAISLGAFVRRQTVIRLAQTHGLISYDSISNAKAAGLLT